MLSLASLLAARAKRGSFEVESLPSFLLSFSSDSDFFKF